ncbi:CaiB/BaiF CoA transferase family protein [Arvimicrobium flavum]|uniref:CaiB/BaiF CoA transferase family protein n=1 Tax=Arvimicrobium flavum TaxID=3393320 RepID=UPI00237B2D15|nr:CoA transferase [Mesorhizobium shangrilense]
MSVLQGCRILDLGIITAGAATSAILADLGAEVIKIESPTYRDPFRVWTGNGPNPGDLPPLFRATNRNKRAISIDLKQARGREVMLRLVASSDVVVENFRRGVLPKLGLSFEELRAANGKIVLASVSSQGETGADARHVSYGSTLEAVAGFAWGTGYAGEDPLISGRDVNYPDQVAAVFAAGMIMAALRSVNGGGPAVHLDLSQRDLTSFLIGEAFVSASAGNPGGRKGNAQEAYLLQDCFKARNDAWIAVSVRQTELAAICSLLGIDPQSSVAALRGTLERHIACIGSESAIAALRQAGVAAAPVLDGGGILGLETEFWSHAIQRFDGKMVKGFPFQIDGQPLGIERGAPSVGTDTQSILSDVAGYDEREIAALVEAGAIEIGAS